MIASGKNTPYHSVSKTTFFFKIKLSIQNHILRLFPDGIIVRGISFFIQIKRISQEM